LHGTYTCQCKGLAPREGAMGADADLALWDRKKKVTTMNKA
jgi:hypothetical protein